MYASTGITPPTVDDAPAACVSSLDPLETNVGFDPPSVSRDEFDRRRDLHQRFRHSFWLKRRGATLAAFRRLPVPADRLKRFDDCGSTLWVLKSTADPPAYRLASNKCHDRFCEACQVERRRTVARNLQTGLEGKCLRLLTLTLKASDVPLRDQLARLYASFRRLRHASPVRTMIDGGVYFLELTLNQKTDRWHPHLHVLFEGSYLPQELVKRLWLEITGDSFIVDVRALRDSEAAASYVAKYASKSLDAHVWRSPDRLAEAIVALNGRRAFQTFGGWTSLSLSVQIRDDREWIPVAPLWRILDAADQRDDDATQILRYLRRGTPLPTDDLGADPSDRPP